MSVEFQALVPNLTRVILTMHHYELPQIRVYEVKKFKISQTPKFHL